METFFEAHSGDSADRTADQFMEYLLKWSGRSHGMSADDDLTLIIIDVVSESDNRVLE
jgi:hypothetical protein